MMRSLFLHPPSFDGFDGGAGSRYQPKREIRFCRYSTRPAMMRRRLREGVEFLQFLRGRRAAAH